MISTEAEEVLQQVPKGRFDVLGLRITEVKRRIFEKLMWVSTRDRGAQSNGLFC